MTYYQVPWWFRYIFRPHRLLLDPFVLAWDWLCDLWWEIQMRNRLRLGSVILPVLSFILGVIVTTLFFALLESI